MARFAGMSNAALIELLQVHVPPNQVEGTGPWALCTLCDTWQTVSQDKLDQIMDQIDRKAATLLRARVKASGCAACTLLPGRQLASRAIVLSTRMMRNLQNDHSSQACNPRRCAMMARQIARHVISTRPGAVVAVLMSNPMRPHVAGRIYPCSKRPQNSWLHVERTPPRWCCARFTVDFLLTASSRTRTQAT